MRFGVTQTEKSHFFFGEERVSAIYSMSVDPLKTTKTDIALFALKHLDGEAAAKATIKAIVIFEVVSQLNKENTTDNSTESSASDPKGARTEPKDLLEQLAMDEAKGGAGKNITDKLTNPEDKYHPETGTVDKISHNSEHNDGTSTDVHYDRNRETGEGEGFKIKDDTNAASRGHIDDSNPPVNNTVISDGNENYQK